MPGTRAAHPGDVTNALKARPLLAGRPPSTPRSDTDARVLAVLELGIGAAALAGGALLAAVPDGSLLRADPRVLIGTPFADWRVPGLLLATLVGGGFLLPVMAMAQPLACPRSFGVRGVGLIAFEAAEVAWIGFQPCRRCSRSLARSS
jgi:hypothetical protein